MRVTVVQTGHVPEDPDVAWAALEGALEAHAADTDVVVFPELATTPYFGCTGDDRYRGWAEPVSGPRVARVARVAGRLGVGVVFGFYEQGEDGVLYNSAVVIERDGTVVTGTGHDGTARTTYRKSSIPQGLVGASPVDEKQFFEPGDGVVVFDAFGTRAAVLICYDRTFPEYWLAARAAGAELVFVLVSSMGFRELLFVPELQVRALETQVWVVAANRAGVEEIAGTSTDYFGLSVVVAPDARVVAQAPAHEADRTIGADLDLAEVAATRASFPLGRDRRPAMFGYLARQMQEPSA